MEDSVGSGHIKQCAVDAHVPCYGSGVSTQWDWAHGLSGEAVDEHALVAGDDKHLVAVRREKKVQRMECAFLKINVSRGEGRWSQSICVRQRDLLKRPKRGHRR